MDYPYRIKYTIIEMKRKDMKTILTKIRILTILTALLSVTDSMAQGTITEEGVVYTLNGDHYEVTAFDLASAEAAVWKDTVVIAEDIEDVPVTVIADNAFDATVNSDCAKIKSVELGSNITAIGSYAFYLCKSLTDVIIYDKLETIGNSAFYGCTALTSIDLPATMRRIGNSAFYGCKSVLTLTIAADNLDIETSAFASCASLRTIRFKGLPPTVGATAFYGVGRSNSPAYVYIPTDLLNAYIARMAGSGTMYGWKEGEGYLALRVQKDGLVYTYIAAEEATPAYLQISAVDNNTLVNKATEESPAYLLQSEASIYNIPVKDMAVNAFSTTKSENIFAVDLRKSALTGFNVDRTAGHFAGVATNTIVYLPAGNTTEDANVIIGGAVATQLQIGRPARILTADEVASGRATWHFNNYRGYHVFGQQIGTDATPLPMTDIDRQEVWQAAFRHADARQYRYANANKTVTIPTAVELGFSEGQAFNCYAGDDIDQRFTAASPLTQDEEVYAYPQVSSLTLNTDTLTFLMSTIASQRQAVLTATAQPADGRQEVTWTSSHPEIVSVDSNGQVKALKAGKAVITATSKDNNAVTSVCRITVVPLVERVELSETEITIALSAIYDPVYQLSATCYPLEAIQDVTWESQDAEICTVDGNGLVTGISAGKTAIICTPKDNTGIMTVCYVTILPAANSVWISRNTYTMLPNDLEQLRAKVQPSTAIQTIKWTTSDESVATVSEEGVVRAKSPGEAVITATSVAMPSLSNKCVITVAGQGTKTTINGFSYEITQLDADAQTMKVTAISDKMLKKGGELTIPEKVYYARLDFNVREVAADAVGQTANNTFVYVPKGITYQGEAPNVIVATNSGTTCRELIITDGYDFAVSHSFIADKLTYIRTCPVAMPFPICLPYTLKSEEEKIRFFDLKEQQGTLLTFEEVSETEPYKPYVALAFSRTADLGGVNVKISTKSRNTDVYVGSCQFIGTMRQIDGASIMEAGGHLIDNGEWYPVSAESVVPPLSAWLATTEGGNLGIELVDIEEPTTGISRHSVAGHASDHIYDLRGRMVGTDASRLPSGIYIRNGKKFVK